MSWTNLLKQMTGTVAKPIARNTGVAAPAPHGLLGGLGLGARQTAIPATGQQSPIVMRLRDMMRGSGGISNNIWDLLRAHATGPVDQSLDGAQRINFFGAPGGDIEPQIKAAIGGGV